MLRNDSDSVKYEQLIKIKHMLSNEIRMVDAKIEQAELLLAKEKFHDMKKGLAKLFGLAELLSSLMHEKKIIGMIASEVYDRIIR